MCNPAQRSLYPADNCWHIREKVFQDIRINSSCIIGTVAGLPFGCLSIVVSLTFSGGIMVYHRIHITGGNSKKQVRSSQFFEVAQIVFPVGLGYYCYAQAFGFEYPTNYRSTKRRVIDICVAGKKNYI